MTNDSTRVPDDDSSWSMRIWMASSIRLMRLWSVARSLPAPHLPPSSNKPEPCVRLCANICRREHSRLICVRGSKLPWG